MVDVVEGMFQRYVGVFVETKNCHIKINGIHVGQHTNVPQVLLLNGRTWTSWDLPVYIYTFG